MADSDLLASKLCQDLALLKQAFTELESMGVLGMETLDGLPEPKRRIAGRLVGRVRRHLHIVDTLFARAAADPDAPIVKVPTSLIRFYETERNGRLRELPEIPDDLLLENFLEDIDAYVESRKFEIPEPSESRTLSSTFEIALEFVQTSIDQDGCDEDFAIEMTENLKAFYWMLDHEILAFDDWSRRLLSLRAVGSSKSAEKIPKRIHQRLSEVYRSFVFGNWLSTVAMSRALLEYAILERGPSLSLEVYESDANRKNRPKRLSTLIEIVSECMEHLREDLEAIVNYGNEVMHPAKKGYTTIRPPGEIQATDCVERLRRVLTALYSA